MTAKQILNKQIKHRREWQDIMATVDHRERNQKEAEEIFSNCNDPLQIQKGAERLRRLSDHIATKGLLRCIDGDLDDGMSNIHLSVSYLFWWIKIAASLAKTGAIDDRKIRARVTLCLPCCANLLCYSDLFNLPQWKSVCVNLLSMPVLLPQVVLPGYWDDRCFEPFVLRRFTEVIDESTAIQPPYDQLTGDTVTEKGWNDACEYHCRNMRKVNNRMPEFECTPFDLFPFEIYAVANQTGQTECLPNHPLLRELPKPTPPNVSDSLVDLAQRAYENVWGNST